MPATLYDVAHFCSWNGYTDDMRSYLGIDKASWTNSEFWKPFGANILYGPKKKSRIQCICEKEYEEARLAARVEKLLANGAKPDIRDADGWTPLLVCARQGHSDTAKLLLDAGANVNHCATYSPLHYAASNGIFAIVRLLIRRGADVNIPSSDAAAATPIEFAVKNGHIDIVKYLVKNGAIINNITFKRAITENRPSILKYFHSLGHQAPENSIHYAISYLQPTLIHLLSKIGANLNYIENGRTPVKYALDLRNYIAMDALGKAGADMNMSGADMPLIYMAVMNMDFMAVRIICAYRINMDLIHNGETILHYCIHAMIEAYPHVYDDYMNCLKEILKKPMNFHQKDVYGITALSYAEMNAMSDAESEIKRAMLRSGQLPKKLNGAAGKPNFPLD